MHYLLFYEVDDDYVSKRAEFRNEHLKKAWQSSERGELMLGGALANPLDGAVLLFKGDSPEIAERFAKADPYVTGGAVKRWYVREWTTVAGEDAAAPIHPNPDEYPTKLQAASSESQANSSFAKGAIVRIWRGHSLAEKAPKYTRHATETVFPKLRKVPGNRGAFLMERRINRKIEFLVLSLWDSMEAIQKFAAQNPDQAVVEPDAKAVLSDFDDYVTHYTVVNAT